MEISRNEIVHANCKYLSCEVHRTDGGILNFLKETYPFMFKKASCHQNSLNFMSIIQTTPCFKESFKSLFMTIVEGVVVTDDEYAFPHIWNKVTDGDKIQYHDITCDLVWDEPEKETPKIYYVVNDSLTIDELTKRAKDGNVFSEETNSLISSYYNLYPKHKDAFFRSYKELNNQAKDILIHQ